MNGFGDKLILDSPDVEKALIKPKITFWRTVIIAIDIMKIGTRKIDEKRILSKLTTIAVTIQTTIVNPIFPVPL